jgi:hypothetical protein
MLVNAIIAKLKTGSIQQVILFGDTDKMPKDLPYAVVKPENGAIAGTRQFRIIVHHKAGYYDVLHDYVFRESVELLFMDSNGRKIFLTDEEGDVYQLHCGGWTDVMPDTSDNTIFMERIFFQPMRSGG